MIPRTRIRKVRSKPRPGRLRGKKMEALRREVFERDGYQCQHFRIVGSMMVFGVEVPTWGRCRKAVTWDSGHLAHVVSRGRGGPDTAQNCVTKCAHCHLVLEHQQGGKGKIVPRKEA